MTVVGVALFGSDKQQRLCKLVSFMWEMKEKKLVHIN